MAKPKSLYTTAPEPTSGTVAKPRSLYTYAPESTSVSDNGKTAQVRQWQNRHDCKSMHQNPSGTMANPRSLYTYAPEPTSGTIAKPRKWDNGNLKAYTVCAETHQHSQALDDTHIPSHVLDALPVHMSERFRKIELSLGTSLKNRAPGGVQKASKRRAQNLRIH